MKQPQNTLAESVSQHIACRILDGDFPPGLHLPGENELSTEYNVSRTSIRNALQFLAAKGLISIQPKKRTIINKRERWNLLDADVLSWLAEGSVDQQLVEQLMVTRLVFEPNVATLAAMNANGHDLAALEDALQLMKDGQHKAQAAIFEQGDLAFHHALLHAAHNPFLVSLGNALSSAMSLSFQQTLEDDLRQTQAAVDEHAELLEAVRLRQPERARQQMRTILLNAARKHIWQDQPELLNLIV